MRALHERSTPQRIGVVAPLHPVGRRVRRRRAAHHDLRGRWKNSDWVGENCWLPKGQV